MNQKYTAFFILSLVLANLDSAQLFGQQTPREAQRQPVNRLGAHFDAPQNQQSPKDQFQQAVAATYHASGISSQRPTDGNSGLPYQSRRTTPQIRPTASNHSSRSGAGNPVMRNVAYGTKQQGDSYPPPVYPGQASGFRPTLQDGVLRVYDCSIQFIDDIDLPALESGQIRELLVKEGDAVSAGKVVGQIDDSLFNRMLEQAKLKQEIADKKATDNTSINAADNEIGLAEEEFRRTRNLYLKGSKSESEYEQAKFRLQIARLKRVAAQNEKDFAFGESKVEASRVQEATERIRRHKLISGDFDGFVIDIEKDPLEWVNAGDTVMRVARMDRLWVQGIVNFNDVNPHELMNRPVKIMVELARGQSREFDGKVINVGLERESATNYMIKAEVINEPVDGHWVLQPGSTVQMSINLGNLGTTNSTTAAANVPGR